VSSHIGGKAMRDGGQGVGCLSAKSYALGYILVIFVLAVHRVLTYIVFDS
jgi:hypothetical protein